MKTVDLISFSAIPVSFRWELGKVHVFSDSPADFCSNFKHILKESGAEGFFFWGPGAGALDIELIKVLLEKRIDCFHGGLNFGLKGLPRIMDYAHPAWMLNCDPDEDIEITSWKISLRACFISREVIERIGFIEDSFNTLDCAALELGHRYITSGVIIRHIPGLIKGVHKTNIPFSDELLFVYFRFGLKRAFWSLMRSVVSRRVVLLLGFKNLIDVMRKRQDNKKRYHVNEIIGHGDGNIRVSVIIPTFARYLSLKVLLKQLRGQVLKPHEIIIIDQNIKEERQPLTAEFNDLPLKVFFLDKAGQCSARNIGIKMASGDFILFLDDDDEVGENLIKLHVDNLLYFNADVSSGIAVVPGEEIPEKFNHIRVSDVFPTNNTLIKRDVFRKTGLFDLAYEHGPRADGDMGIRVYLSGALMILNNKISLLHHHSRHGGLRMHKARIVSSSKARKSIFRRHLISPTEIYLIKRYFNKEQLKEAVFRNILNTFRIESNAILKILKAIVAFIYLPSTIFSVLNNVKKAEELFKNYPIIDKYD